MDCQACQPLLAEYALGQLAEDERNQLALHLAGCHTCRQVLRETEEAWVALAVSLPRATVPPHVQMELRDRIARQRELVPAFTPEHDELALENRRSPSRRHLAIAASLFLAFTVALLSWLAYREQQWERQAREMERLQAELAEANELFNAGRLHFASLREAGGEAAVRGYIVWDRLSRQIHFYAFDLPPLAEGRVWRLWLHGKDHEPIAAGTLEPQANRSGRAVIDAPAQLGDQFRLAVVDDPSEPPSKPSREPWLTAHVE